MALSYITITNDNISLNCEREEMQCTKNVPLLITLKLRFFENEIVWKGLDAVSMDLHDFHGFPYFLRFSKSPVILQKPSTVDEPE